MVNSQSKYFNENFLDRIICFLLTVTLIVDTITGFFQSHGLHLPISQVFKLLLMVLISIRLLCFTYFHLQFSIYALLSIFILLLHACLASHKFSDTITLYSKFIIAVVVYYYMRALLHSRTFTLRIINNIFMINCYVILFNVTLLGIFKIGEAQYDGRIGSKGFFYAGNELSAVIIVVFSYMIYRSFSEGWKLKYLFLFLLLFTGIYVTTKTSIIGVIASSIIIPIMVNKRNKHRYNFIQKICLLFIFGLLCTGGYYFISNSGIFERWAFFYEKYGLASLISGRDRYVEEEVINYLNTPWYQQFIGLGGNETVEMDFFDILLNFGYVGLIIVGSFYISIVWRAHKYRKKSSFPLAPLCYVTLIILLSASFLAGHVVFSGMAGPFIGIIASLIFCKEEKTQNIIIKK